MVTLGWAVVSRRECLRGTVNPHTNPRRHLYYFYFTEETTYAHNQKGRTKWESCLRPRTSPLAVQWVLKVRG